MEVSAVQCVSVHDIGSLYSVAYLHNSLSVLPDSGRGAAHWGTNIRHSRESQAVQTYIL